MAMSGIGQTCLCTLNKLI
ncbi:hypothetical protein BIW11_08896 [Tropilaelaps mercedesae]|uniref:Uncharacterized protein n=1 Tax=Tropilaelaps mercedesae TaxID=418985 RepID=A0A1V9XMI9_9ACAR|nr:hypothetical protein BIW11_08896 [Tropilaelaps mercedesae]